ncbi:MAG: response regulator [Gillisia sp.]
MKVLIIEDDPTISKNISEALAAEGLNTELAINGLYAKTGQGAINSNNYLLSSYIKKEYKIGLLWPLGQLEVQTTHRVFTR